MRKFSKISRFLKIFRPGQVPKLPMPNSTIGLVHFSNIGRNDLKTVYRDFLNNGMLNIFSTPFCSAPYSHTRIASFRYTYPSKFCIMFGDVISFGSGSGAKENITFNRLSERVLQRFSWGFWKFCVVLKNSQPGTSTYKYWLVLNLMFVLICRSLGHFKRSSCRVNVWCINDPW